MTMILKNRRDSSEFIANIVQRNTQKTLYFINFKVKNQHNSTKRINNSMYYVLFSTYVYLLCVFRICNIILRLKLVIYEF